MAETNQPASDDGEPMAIEDTLYARRLFNAPVDQLTVQPSAEDAEPAPSGESDEVDPWTEGP